MKNADNFLTIFYYLRKRFRLTPARVSADRTPLRQKIYLACVIHMVYVCIVNAHPTSLSGLVPAKFFVYWSEIHYNAKHGSDNGNASLTGYNPQTDVKPYLTK